MLRHQMNAMCTRGWVLGLSLAFAACATHTAAPANGPERSAGGEDPPNPPVAKVDPATAESVVPAAVVAVRDRSDADRVLDPQRKPEAFLAFLDLQPGDRVAEIAAGTGYTTELLARAVGPTGVVYGVNNAFVLEKFAEGPWSARLQKPIMANVVRVDREFDDPLPPDATGLDMVCNVLFYHDSVWMETDRLAMNQAVYAALKAGGTYVIVDHAAAAGHGVQDAQTLHRIEPSVVRAEVESAGFVFVEASEFLENPDDARDWNAAPSAAGTRRGQSDRFTYKFKKPN